MPDLLSPDEAAPLLCAGITVYNSLRNAGARPGDLVAIHGIGGLGHLGLQYARQMGFRTVAIGRGRDKEPMAKKLGAHDYLDFDAGSPVEALQTLGGARVILATAPDSQAMSSLIEGVGPGGTLLVIGATVEPLSISPAQLLGGANPEPGLRRCAAVQRADRSTLDDRPLPARQGRAGLRPDAQRAGPVPGGAHHGHIPYRERILEFMHCGILSG